MEAPLQPVLDALALATAAERRARHLALALVEAGRAPGASELAKVHADLGALMVVNAEQAARLVHRSRMDETLAEISRINGSDLPRETALTTMAEAEERLRMQVDAVAARAWVHCLSELDRCFEHRERGAR